MNSKSDINVHRIHAPPPPKESTLWRPKPRPYHNEPRRFDHEQEPILLHSSDDVRRQWLINQANEIRATVRKELPNRRPLWMPHYFWHWLHLAPHFHVLRHKRRVPWIASSAKYFHGDISGAHAEDAQIDDYDYNDYQFDDEAYGEYQDETYDDEYGGYYADYGAVDEYEEDEGYYDGYGVAEDEWDEMGMDMNSNRYQNENEDVNVLENGDDFSGNYESLSEEMWSLEALLFFLFVGVLFCVIACCFVWKSKWGHLIRRLNEARLDRNRRIQQAKLRSDMHVLSSDGSESSSSVLNISDAAPFSKHDFDQ